MMIIIILMQIFYNHVMNLNPMPLILLNLLLIYLISYYHLFISLMVYPKSIFLLYMHLLMDLLQNHFRGLIILDLKNNSFQFYINLLLLLSLLDHLYLILFLKLFDLLKDHHFHRFIQVVLLLR